MPLNAWWILIRERFSPLIYIPTVLALVAALIQAPQISDQVLKSLGLGLGTLWFLFLLRCYDEIKDYDCDLIHKTHRPLARGAVSAQALQARLIPMGLLWTLYSWALHPQFPALAYSLWAWLWSLAMYKEFGISAWIRPKLTRYALSHTWVMVPLSLWIMSTMGVPSWSTALAVWALFNLFEFGRKTFAPSEETREMSYSLRFGPRKAWALSASQILLALVLWPSSLGAGWDWTLFGLWILGSSPYLIQANQVWKAQLLRGSCSAYLLISLILHIFR